VLWVLVLLYTGIATDGTATGTDMGKALAYYENENKSYDTANDINVYTKEKNMTCFSCHFVLERRWPKQNTKFAPSKRFWAGYAIVPKSTLNQPFQTTAKHSTDVSHYITTTTDKATF